VQPPAVRQLAGHEDGERRLGRELVQLEPERPEPARGRLDAVREGEVERPGRERAEVDRGHLEPVERGAVDRRLDPQERAALGVDRELDRVRPRAAHAEQRGEAAPVVRPRRGRDAHGRAPRDLGRAAGAEAEDGRERARVEEEPVARGSRSLVVRRLARDRSPVLVPRGPALAVPDEEPRARLDACGLLAEAGRALVREPCRPGGLLLPRAATRDAVHERAGARRHETPERLLAPGRVAPVDDGQRRGPRALRRVVEEHQELTERGHGRSVHRRDTTRNPSRMLGAPARGDRPAKPRRRWHTSLAISSRRPSTT
jgi:hypothetical protein